MSRSITISLLVGWQEDPFYYDWYDPEQYSHSIEEAAEELQLSADLVADITAWDDEYQATYDPTGSRGLESGFASPEAEEEWRERGKILAARIKQESPVVASVSYRANGIIPPGTCMF
ncbi:MULTISPECIES: hypothetical protein [Actinoalloteichus]|uniref:Uncharacterized protein n=1 Tax=Actinoalloteichus fjordicus TaxID=1612552 RepID=A0AAC9PTC2_9PSEU|nr:MULTISPECIES: hypothetical protein [Actinoalloteichus]APU15726.1 hypothetical protein UA74_18490 [Actinoalloteichus fjordicus]APU21786.1 hypothetical protein UA75_18980 [Actinoalloteichus sp. GBA129-24]